MAQGGTRDPPRPGHRCHPAQNRGGLAEEVAAYRAIKRRPALPRVTRKPVGEYASRRRHCAYAATLSHAPPQPPPLAGSFLARLAMRPSFHSGPAGLIRIRPRVHRANTPCCPGEHRPARPPPGPNFAFPKKYEPPPSPTFCILRFYYFAFPLDTTSLFPYSQGKTLTFYFAFERTPSWHP